MWKSNQGKGHWISGTTRPYKISGNITKEMKQMSVKNVYFLNVRRANMTGMCSDIKQSGNTPTALAARIHGLITSRRILK